MARWTKEEIEDNYEFKVVRRILKKEFPWIKDMKLSSKWEDYKSLFFLDIFIDGDALLSSLDPTIVKDRRQWDWFTGSGVPYLSLIVPFKHKDIAKKANDLSYTVKKTMNRVQESPSIPVDMKLPRELSISSWRIANDQPQADNLTTTN